MSDDLDVEDEPRRISPPWGDEITPFTEVCGGQYVLLHELAQGDVSVVYRAKATGSPDVIAFKLMQPRYIGDETQIRRFRREAELLHRIEHPNIVRLLDHGTIEDSREFLALELLVGRTLAEALSEAERMSPERTCRIARQIARALRAMHRVGVIHRDLEPDNIVLIGPDEAERVKLVDFTEAGDVGAPARRVKEPEQDGDDEPQAPSYRPPEQVRRRPPQPSMDVFALGVIMFEMLAGQHPFVDAKDKVGQTIRSKAFDAPEVLLGLVGDCIERRPRDRPRSMDEVLERLDKALLWMGVVPHELDGNAPDEDERTQPYTVADPGHVPIEAEEEAPAPKPPPPASEPKTPSREGATVAGEVVLSATDPFDEDLIQTQRQRILREEEEREQARASSRRRVGSDRSPASGSWDDRASDSWGDERPSRTRTRDESWDDSQTGGSIHAGRDAWDDARLGRQPPTGRDAWDNDSRSDGQPPTGRDAWDDERRTGRHAPVGRDESWDDGQRTARHAPGGPHESWDTGRHAPVGPHDDRSESWDDSRSGRRPPDEFRADDRRAPRSHANADGPTSSSVPRIDLEELREKGAPDKPRFVVDTVAWTKQQPSARNKRPRQSKSSSDRASYRDPKRSRDPQRSRDPKRPREQSRSPRAQRHPTDPRPRSRPPTAAQAPVDPLQAMPRWVLLLSLMVLVGLAYAVWLVWTH